MPALSWDPLDSTFAQWAKFWKVGRNFSEFLSRVGWFRGVTMPCEMDLIKSVKLFPLAWHRVIKN